MNEKHVGIGIILLCGILIVRMGSGTTIASSSRSGYQFEVTLSPKNPNRQPHLFFTGTAGLGRMWTRIGYRDWMRGNSW